MTYENIFDSHETIENITINQITEDILKNNSLGNIQAMTEEILNMWGSIQKFIDSGFGYCALEKNDITCWCTAEYVSKKYCGIGIETIENFQSKGIAGNPLNKPRSIYWNLLITLYLRVS